MNANGTPVLGVPAGGRDERSVTTGGLEAIVFREILKPLAAGLGPVGEVALGSVADTLFARLKA